MKANKTANDNYETALADKKKLRLERDKYRKQRDGYAKKLNLEVPADAAETTLLWGVAWWWWPLGGGILLVLTIGTVLTSMGAQKEELGYGPDDDDELGDEVNFEASDGAPPESDEDTE